MLTRKQFRLLNHLRRIAQVIGKQAFEFDPVSSGYKDKTLHALRDYGMIEIEDYANHYIVRLD